VELWLECLKEKKSLLLPCYLNSTLCKIKMKQWESAVAAASSALKLDDKNAKGFFRRGLANKGRAHFAEAKTDMLRAAKLQPQNKQIRKELQQVITILKTEAGAPPGIEDAEPLKPAFRQGLGLYADKKEEDWTEKNDKIKTEVMNLCSNAGSLRNGGKLKEAMEVYQLAMRRVIKLKEDADPRLVGSDQPSTMGSKLELKLGVHVGAAECSMQMGNFEKAEADFDKAAQVAGTAAEAAKGDVSRVAKLQAMAAQLQGMAKEAWTISQKNKGE
jgi:tetratricopeptide (TPR) repeat protein